MIKRSPSKMSNDCCVFAVVVLEHYLQDVGVEREEKGHVENVHW